jgi:Helix-turn-helix domain of resolvase
MSREPEPRARGRAGRRVIDWHQAAELLAQGLRAAAVAARVGCARATLARKCRHDPAFQKLLACCRDAQSEQEGSELADLRDTLHRAIEAQVRDGNVRVILWLADRLKLVTPPSARTPEQELRALLRGLTSEELREFESLRDAP